MFLGGLQRHSLIDYPGRVSCVCFLQGCNFRCPYCHNPDLVSRKNPSAELLSDKAFFEFLETRKGLLDAVVVSGGEPTLEEHLPAFCERIKEMGFSVKLDTNGSRPGVIRDLLKNSVLDYIAMDLKTEPERYPALVNGRFVLEDLLESIGVLLESSIQYEFRTTCVRPFVDASVMRRMARLIGGAEKYVLQAFRRSRMLDPDFFEGVEPGYAEEGMLELKAVAAPFVKDCSIRGL
jgi:pyruvate formate lyase activating enzyme